MDDHAKELTTGSLEGAQDQLKKWAGRGEGFSFVGQCICPSRDTNASHQGLTVSVPSAQNDNGKE
jgi:hypothetical protein